MTCPSWIRLLGDASEDVELPRGTRRAGTGRIRRTAERHPSARVALHAGLEIHEVDASERPSETIQRVFRPRRLPLKCPALTRTNRLFTRSYSTPLPLNPV